jgi:hypothetical protein
MRLAYETALASSAGGRDEHEGRLAAAREARWEAVDELERLRESDAARAKSSPPPSPTASAG